MDLVKRKKHVLDDLYNAGKISQYTYEYLGKEVTEEIAEVEARRKALTERMTRKLNQLEEQLKTLEIFLAISEMAYAAEEISQEVHTAESNALSLGMEATKQESNTLKEVIIQLIPKETVTTSTLTPTSIQVETAESTPTEPIVEKQSEVTTKAAIEPQIEVPTATGGAIEQPIPVPSEGGGSPFQSESGNQTTKEENKERQG